MLEVIQEIERDGAIRTKEEIYKNVKERKREKLEDEQLLQLLTDSLKKLPI